MKKLLARSRTELLLFGALLVPMLAPARSDLKSLAAVPLRLLPAAGPAGPAASGSEATWREAFYRQREETARLEDRLLALGEPAGLKPMDPAYWARNPLRIEAAIVAHDGSPFRGSILVSAGTREGVRAELAVVVGSRLVGKVASVGELDSRVRLLTDPGCEVWAQVLSGEGEAQGVVTGDGSDRLAMERVVAGVAKVGDPVYTVGGDRLVPRGLLIGTVSRVADIDRNGVAEIELTPEITARKVNVVNILAPPE